VIGNSGQEAVVSQPEFVRRVNIAIGGSARGFRANEQKAATR